jgi:hypothetical protein
VDFQAIFNSITGLLKERRFPIGTTNRIESGCAAKYVPRAFSAIAY